MGSALLVLATMAVVVAAQLNSLEIATCIGAGASAPDCLDRLQAFGDQQSRAAPLEMGISVIALFAGVVLGSPLVSRDLEQGTAQSVWSLAGSRRRWVVPRVAAVGLALAILCGVAAAASFSLEGAARPLVDPAASMVGHNLRGPVIVARALMAFGLAICAGAVLGRVLPTVLLSSLVSVAIFFSIGAMSDSWLRAEAVPLANLQAASPVTDEIADLVVEIRYRDETGRLLNASEASAAVSESGELVEERFELVRFGIPGARWPAITTRESLTYLAIGIAAMAAGILVVERRRPY